MDDLPLYRVRDHRWCYQVWREPKRRWPCSRCHSLPTAVVQARVSAHWGVPLNEKGQNVVFVLTSSCSSWVGERWPPWWSLDQARRTYGHRSASEAPSPSFMVVRVICCGWRSSSTERRRHIVGLSKYPRTGAKNTRTQDILHFFTKHRICSAFCSRWKLRVRCIQYRNDPKCRCSFSKDTAQSLTPSCALHL